MPAKTPGKAARKPAAKAKPKTVAKVAAKPAAKPAPKAASKPASGADPIVLGQPAPDLELRDHDAQPWCISDLKGKRAVLYFYPKDMTSGCTLESCEFQASLKAFQDLNAVVIGISPDDAESHRKFRAKHDLEFTLAYGPDNKVLEAFGVWKEKNMYGRKYMGVERSTFLLDEQGIVRGVWRKVKPEGHAAEVLEALKKF
jgi:peroxiredoxin Q/BCP